MLQMFAPYPENNKIINLPNPLLRDSITLNSTVRILDMMQGDPYTYVTRRKDKNTFRFNFDLTREKWLQFKDYYRLYGHQKIQIINYDDAVLVGYFITNPFLNSGNRRGVIGPNKETWSTSFQFEVTQ